MNKEISVMCPKCRYIRKESDIDTTPEWQCPKCGIVYAKFGKEHHTRIEEEPEFYGKKKRSKKRLSLLPILLISGVMTFTVMLFKRKLVVHLDIVSMIMAVILYISFIPMLSALFGDKLYMWNKYNLHFEPYDKTAHPILTAIYFIIGLAVSITIISLLFGKSTFLTKLGWL